MMVLFGVCYILYFVILPMFILYKIDESVLYEFCKIMWIKIVVSEELNNRLMLVSCGQKNKGN